MKTKLNYLLGAFIALNLGGCGDDSASTDPKPSTEQTTPVASPTPREKAALKTYQSGPDSIASEANKFCETIRLPRQYLWKLATKAELDKLAESLKKAEVIAATGITAFWTSEYVLTSGSGTPTIMYKQYRTDGYFGPGDQANVVKVVCTPRE